MRPMFGEDWWDVVVKLWLRCTLEARCTAGRLYWLSAIILSVERDGCTGRCTAGRLYWLSAIILSVERDGCTRRWFRASRDLAPLTYCASSVMTPRGMTAVCCDSVPWQHTAASAACKSRVDVGFVVCRWLQVTTGRFAPATLAACTAIRADTALSLPTDLEMAEHQTHAQ